MIEVCGRMDGVLLYRLEISVFKFQRLVELSVESVDVPNWMDLGQSTVQGRRVILTDDPNWFGKDY